MEPQHTGDLLRHMEKQNELLKESRKTMQQELQKLEVEEHMLMDKFYELMVTRRLNKKTPEIRVLPRANDRYEDTHPPILYQYQRRNKTSKK